MITQQQMLADHVLFYQGDLDLYFHGNLMLCDFLEEGGGQSLMSMQQFT